VSQQPQPKVSLQGLEKGVDYLWCEACKRHVECIRTASGWFEVLCPNCVGECSMCKCHLRDCCFGRREGSPPIQPNAVVPDCPHSPTN